MAKTGQFKGQRALAKIVAEATKGRPAPTPEQALAAIQAHAASFPKRPTAAALVAAARTALPAVRKLTPRQKSLQTAMQKARAYLTASNAHLSIAQAYIEKQNERSARAAIRKCEYYLALHKKWAARVGQKMESLHTADKARGAAAGK